MSISFSNALGIHEQALNVRSQRAEVLANNLANADTPGFKARDFDFKAALNQASNNQMKMQTTQGNHLTGSAGAAGAPDQELLYRTPLQPSLDGNTVDSQMELSAYMRNAMDFQSSFQFLNSKFQGLSRAIKGE
ncbi:flagellar basal body rod protein FlgB [Hydrocarboniclastica marina]|uniref:Flagellar basal body rod protein FlgB n=1 Tax=Hydrocarboniclastica marina TaxID=2259620 RepID=A0A4P7XGT6_9ALTE|nr:flagellar basal body rod protein FlgB [Hydrocarboniclastica marina]MAL98383.1 flagellar basal body rod protein FlgB [Alteromonadaceae bacterium]QCF25853.1 flagellar basal body rod protein FlgB [Hydrocarboniclastica marina]